MPSHDKYLISLVQKQTNLFNQDAPEADKVKVLNEIREYKDRMKER